MSFRYQYEKMSIARRALMLPHPNGEVESIVVAFGECGHALHHLDRSDIDDEVANQALEVIDRVMNVDGLEDTDHLGLNYVKAESLSDAEKSAFSDAVDNLTSYFDRESQREVRR